MNFLMCGSAYCNYYSAWGQNTVKHLLHFPECVCVCVEPETLAGSSSESSQSSGSTSLGLWAETSPRLLILFLWRWKPDIQTSLWMSGTVTETLSASLTHCSRTGTKNKVVNEVMQLHFSPRLKERREWEADGIQNLGDKGFRDCSCSMHFIGALLWACREWPLGLGSDTVGGDRNNCSQSWTVLWAGERTQGCRKSFLVHADFLQLVRFFLFCFFCMTSISEHSVFVSHRHHR